MRWIDLVWLLPVMLAVAIVLGATGRQGVRTIMRSIMSSFVYLTIGVLTVGVVIHVVSLVFA
ncbi:MAG: hypothetical protein QNJ90_13335 [Planctomycetota bacterium]|nr:hypothetical protein [Planctomycetota bacterium]